MTEPKFLKRLFPMTSNEVSMTALKEGTIFYDMDNDAFYVWEKGHLNKYIRAPKNPEKEALIAQWILEEKNEKDKG